MPNPTTPLTSIRHSMTAFDHSGKNTSSPLKERVQQIAAVVFSRIVDSFLFVKELADNFYHSVRSFVEYIDSIFLQATEEQEKEKIAQGTEEIRQVIRSEIERNFLEGQQKTEVPAGVEGAIVTAIDARGVNKKNIKLGVRGLQLAMLFNIAAYHARGNSSYMGAALSSFHQTNAVRRLATGSEHLSQCKKVVTPGRVLSSAVFGAAYLTHHQLNPGAGKLSFALKFAPAACALLPECATKQVTNTPLFRQGYSHIESVETAFDRRLLVYSALMTDRLLQPYFKNLPNKIANGVMSHLKENSTANGMLSSLSDGVNQTGAQGVINRAIFEVALIPAVQKSSKEIALYSKRKAVEIRAQMIFDVKNFIMQQLFYRALLPWVTTRTFGSRLPEELINPGKVHKNPIIRRLSKAVNIASLLLSSGDIRKRNTWIIGASSIALYLKTDSMTSAQSVQTVTKTAVALYSFKRKYNINLSDLYQNIKPNTEN